MFCKKCGNEIKENDKFCKKCGNAIVLPSVSKTVDNNKEETKKHDKRINIIIILLLCILVAVIAIFIGGVYYLSMNNSSAEESSSYKDKRNKLEIDEENEIASNVENNSDEGAEVNKAEDTKANIENDQVEENSYIEKREYNNYKMNKENIQKDGLYIEETNKDVKSSNGDNSKDSTVNWKKLFLNKIDTIENRDWNSYAVVDIDSDGIPEIFAGCDAYAKQMLLKYSNGEVIIIEFYSKAIEKGDYDGYSVEASTDGKNKLYLSFEGCMPFDYWQRNSCYELNNNELINEKMEEWKAYQEYTDDYENNYEWYFIHTDINGKEIENYYLNQDWLEWIDDKCQYPDFWKFSQIILPVKGKAKTMGYDEIKTFLSN